MCNLYQCSKGILLVRIKLNKYVNYQNENVEYNLSSSGLRLGFQIQCLGWDVSVPIQNYFTINTGRQSELADTGQRFDIEEWGDDFYSDLFSKSRIEFLKDSYGPIYWIKENDDLSVGIYEGGLTRITVSLAISAWGGTSSINTTGWQDFQEILDVIDTTKIVYFMKSKYFDFTDLENPVKFFIREEESNFSVNHTKLSYMTLK